MKISILIFSLFYAMNCYGLDSLSYRIEIEDDLGSSFNELLFGVHKNATEMIDFELGEVDAPQNTPPNSLYAAIIVTDSTDMDVFHTYFDFRPIPKDQYFFKNYKFKVFNLTTPFTISWHELSEYVDSAFIRDIFTGNLVNVDMKKKLSHKIENFSLNQFNIAVYFNQGINYVGNEVCSTYNKYISPNPVIDILKIDLIEYKNWTYRIVNELGCDVQSGTMSADKNILVKNLAGGMYLLILNHGIADIRYFQFLKL